MFVVTGATGHVGSNLLPTLIQRGERVRGVVQRNRGPLHGGRVEVVEADVRDRASLDRAFVGATYVIHLAGKISITGDPDGSMWATNVGGVRNVAAAALAAGVRRMVHISSCHAFDINSITGPADESAGRPGPRHPAYDRSKAAGEVEVRKFIARGLDAVIVNPSGIIGPNDPEPSRMGRFFRMVAEGALPGLVEDGFDWVDVRDVCDGILAALEHGQTGENYILSGHWRRMPELVTLVSELTGQRPSFITWPMWIARAAAPFAMAWAKLIGSEPLFTGEALHALRACSVDHEKATRELGFTSRPTRESIHDLLKDAQLLSQSHQVLRPQVSSSS